MKYKFKRYNSASLGLMDEEVTKNYIRDIYLNQKPSAEESKFLQDSDEWAKYAFENESQYYVTFYKEEKPFVCLNFKKISINLIFLEYNEQNELVEHLRMVYDRYDIMHWIKTDEYKPHPNNKLFLKQVEVIYENSNQKKTYKALFIQKKKLMKVSTTQIDKASKSYNNEEKETKVNLSNNFIEPPKHYLDYAHLFDYKEILKSEYLDIPVSDKE